MKITPSLFALILGLTSLTAFSQITTDKKTCTPCEQLKKVRLPDVTILEATSVSKDTIPGEEGWSPTVVIDRTFCRILGRISKEIKFELLLPADWNGRFLMAGNGGFAGSIQNDLIGRLNEGYAVVGTDTGHKDTGDGAAWALNNMERQLNFGSLAVHRTAEVSKALINSHYCEYPAYSYFLGCSRGGGQAMMEAQAYPEDFDGIVAGAPAHNWPALGAKFVQTSQHMYPDPDDLSKPNLTLDHLKLLQAHVLKQCDDLDGLEDSILNDPRDCIFDFATLPMCPGNAAGTDCFTQEQLAAIQSVYSPLMVDNQEIYPGFPFGLEGEDTAWDLWITGTSPYLEGNPSLHHMFGTNIFKYLVFNDPSWDYSQYDFKNFAQETAFASSFLDATQTNYSGLKDAKGKMILYHGWDDYAISAYATIQHYEKALLVDQELPSYIRLFMLPGVLHCAGGTGPDQVDWVKLISDWVENENAPERVVVSKFEGGNLTMTRPVYPYPKVTVYKGSGDSTEEKNFGVKQ
ncbi:tannase/feruloyl esterase family alpha/beta hydrolase [Algoriphagus jejuensis]|uniref:Tannase/feruloyl esterase family alpha/beta hydrolase n=1 Tax=Algoriphagus jejuensis TaxID=419934 RepID=A0ABN1N570_9BACT